MDQVLLYLISFVLIAYDCAVVRNAVVFCINLENTEVFWCSYTDIEFYIINYVILINIYEPETLDISENDE